MKGGALLGLGLVGIGAAVAVWAVSRDSSRDDPARERLIAWYQVGLSRELDPRDYAVLAASLEERDARTQAAQLREMCEHVSGARCVPPAASAPILGDWFASRDPDSIPEPSPELLASLPPLELDGPEVPQEGVARPDRPDEVILADGFDDATWPPSLTVDSPALDQVPDPWVTAPEMPVDVLPRIPPDFGWGTMPVIESPDAGEPDLSQIPGYVPYSWEVGEGETVLTITRAHGRPVVEAELVRQLNPWLGRAEPEPGSILRLPDPWAPAEWWQGLGQVGDVVPFSGGISGCIGCDGTEEGLRS